MSFFYLIGSRHTEEKPITVTVQYLFKNQPAKFYNGILRGRL